MNLIYKWISTFVIEKIVKASFEALTVYFKNKRLLKLEKEKQIEIQKIRTDNRNKLDNAIKNGDKDAIVKCAENLLNAIDTRNN